MSISAGTSSAVVTDPYTNPYSQYDGSQSTVSFDLDFYNFYNDSTNQTFSNCPSIYGNLTYLNISCDNVLDYSVPLYGYITPFFILITLIANSLIIIVLSRPHMSSPTNAVLMSMAVCDLLTITFPAPGLLYMYSFGQHYKPMGPSSFCQMWILFNETLPAMFHTASIWLTLLLAIQRYIYVCHPIVARTFCTLARVKKVIFFILLAAFLHQSPRFVDTVYIDLEIEWRGGRYVVCVSETAPWVEEYVGENLYFTLYFLFRVLFVHLIPCILLGMLNYSLIMSMRQAQQKRKKLFDNSCGKLKKNDKNCTTLMLIVVLTAFLIVEIPLAIITSAHVFSSLFYNFLDYRLANLGILFTNFFLIISYPINFGIYCGMSRQFRVTFVSLFCSSMNATLNEVTIFRHEPSRNSRYSIVNNGPRPTCNTNESVL